MRGRPKALCPVHGFTREQVRVATLIRAEVALRYPEGVIPPLDGGRFFREMSDRLETTERALAEIGMRDGWWPWVPEEIAQARRLSDSQGTTDTCAY